jgi:hypothetical protein
MLNKVLSGVPSSARMLGFEIGLRLNAQSTAMFAEEVLPVPPLVEATVTLLVQVPTVAPATDTDNVQDAEPAASTPPDRLTTEVPAVAVVEPPQVLIRLGADATTSPAGKLSVNAMPPKDMLEFAGGLAMVNVKEVVWPTLIVFAVNTLLIVGGTAYVKPLANVPNWVSGFVTTTSTAPAACAGVVAVIVVAFTTTTLVAVVPPNVTVAPFTKCVPAMVTAVPPAAGPLDGVTLVGFGAGAYV